MSEEELKVYFSIFNSCWKLFKKYSNPEDNDDFWERLMEDLNEEVENYKNYDFAIKILMQTEKEIEEILKRKRG